MTIDINELTYGQLTEIAERFGAAPKAKAKPHRSLGKKVIVRSYGAGVFYATLVAKRGNEVDLTDCRRIWNWKGANTLSEIALSGIVAQGSRVAEPTPTHTVLDVLEIIECSAAAVKALDAARWQP